MPRYAAFLRGVSPMNAKMAELQRAFEKAGFKDVRTVLSSGNVLFDAPKASVAALERKAEAAMQRSLVKPFLAIVRPVDELRELLATDPYARFSLEPGAKRIVTFVRDPPARLALPIEQHGARVLLLEGNNLFSAYVSTPKGPVFMTLIAKAVGKEQTTRTWKTIETIAR